MDNDFDKPEDQRELARFGLGEKTKAKSTFSISQIRRGNVLSTPISRCVRIGIILTSVRYSSLHSMDILPFRGWLYHTARNSIQVCGYGRMSIR